MPLTTKDFKKALSLLMGHKQIFIPVFIALLLPVGAVLVFISFSGITLMVEDMHLERSRFDSNKIGYIINSEDKTSTEYQRELFQLFDREENQYAVSPEISSALAEKGYTPKRFLSLINLESIIFLLSLLIIASLGSLFFSSASFAFIAQGFYKKDTLINPKKLTLKFFSYLFSSGYVVAMSIVLPLIIFISLAFILPNLLFLIGEYSFHFFAACMILFCLIWIIRFFVTMPRLYVDDSELVSKSKKNLVLTRLHIKEVFLIFVMMIASYCFIYSFGMQEFFTDNISVFFDETNLRLIAFVIITTMLVFLESIIWSLEHVIVFYGYMDLKEIGVKK